MARTIDYCYVSLYRGTLSLRLWRRLTMVFCETSVTEDTTNELWWRFYANNSSFLRELLLRIVFQDWFVDDGNFYPTCGNYDLLFWWKIAKNFLKCVFKVILLVSECRSLCKNFWDQIPRHEFWTWRKSPLFNFVHRTSKSFPAAHCPKWHSLAAIIINLYKPSHFWGQIFSLINTWVWFWNCTNPLVYYYLKTIKVPRMFQRERKRSMC